MILVVYAACNVFDTFLFYNLCLSVTLLCIFKDCDCGHGPHNIIPTSLIYCTYLLYLLTTGAPIFFPHTGLTTLLNFLPCSLDRDRARSSIQPDGAQSIATSVKLLPQVVSWLMHACTGGCSPRS